MQIFLACILVILGILDLVLFFYRTDEDTKPVIIYHYSSPLPSPLPSLSSVPISKTNLFLRHRTLTIAGAPIWCGLWFLVTGSVGACIGNGRKRVSSLYFIKIVYLVMNIISGFIFAPVACVISLAVAYLRRDIDNDTHTLIWLLPVASGVLGLFHLMVAVLAAIICCCCSSTNPSQVDVLVNKKDLEGVTSFPSSSSFDQLDQAGSLTIVDYEGVTRKNTETADDSTQTDFKTPISETKGIQTNLLVKSADKQIQTVAVVQENESASTAHEALRSERKPSTVIIKEYKTTQDESQQTDLSEENRPTKQQLDNLVQLIQPFFEKNGKQALDQSHRNEPQSVYPNEMFKPEPRRYSTHRAEKPIEDDPDQREFSGRLKREYKSNGNSPLFTHRVQQPPFKGEDNPNIGNHRRARSLDMLYDQDYEDAIQQSNLQPKFNHYIKQPSPEIHHKPRSINASHEQPRTGKDTGYGYDTLRKLVLPDWS
ncbi:hypothetical protein SNE40_016473 [Patella caerulea]